MEKVVVKIKKKSKNYIQDLWVLTYPTLLHLIQALFEQHLKGRKDLQNIQLLLQTIGYQNLKDIPKSEIAAIRQLIHTQMPHWMIHEDAEYLTYTFLAAFQQQEILILVDDALVTDLNAPIQLHYQSTIAIIHQPLIHPISFTTL
jgi:hypothetical protein